MTSAYDPAKQPRPVTLRDITDKGHCCEECGQKSNCRVKVVVEGRDIYDDCGGKTYATFCDRKCLSKYHEWCKGLIPGLPHRLRYPGSHHNVVHITFVGIHVPYEGDALHNTWKIHHVLIQEGRRTGMVLTPCDYNGDDERVLLDNEVCVPSIFVSLHKLRKWFPVPVPAH